MEIAASPRITHKAFPLGIARLVVYFVGFVASNRLI